MDKILFQSIASGNEAKDKLTDIRSIAIEAIKFGASVLLPEGTGKITVELNQAAGSVRITAEEDGEQAMTPEKETAWIHNEVIAVLKDYKHAIQSVKAIQWEGDNLYYVASLNDPKDRKTKSDIQGRLYQLETEHGVTIDVQFTHPSNFDSFEGYVLVI
jgi:hypothetical protein